MDESFFYSFPFQYDYLEKFFNSSVIQHETKNEFESLEFSKKVVDYHKNQIQGLGYFTKSEFDTKILERNTGKILKVLGENANAKKRIVKKILEAAKDQQINYLSFRFRHDNELIRVLESFGFGYLDTIVYLYKELKRTANNNPSIAVYTENQKKYLENIAKDAFVYGRFYFDETIERNKADEIYRQWTINSLNKKMCDEIFVYLVDAVPVGFITVKFLKTQQSPKFLVGSIELLCVKKEYHGRGIGKALLSRACEYLSERNTKVALIDTQITNIPAFSLYTSFGFTPGTVFHTYRLLL